jgi:hypothetical protein
MNWARRELDHYVEIQEIISFMKTLGLNPGQLHKESTDENFGETYYE